MNNSFAKELEKFVEQADKQKSLKYAHYIKEYNGTTVKVSFGQGGFAKVPWISFTKKPFTTSDGIYPVYLYYKKLDKIILAYGISETNKPFIDWNLNNPISIKKYFNDNFLNKPDRYGSSYIYKVYDVNNFPDSSDIDNDLNNIITQYDKIISNSLFELNKLKEDNPIVKSSNFNLNNFKTSTQSAGLTYSNQLITRYISSLATKSFVLLSGLSGSGKTKLAQSFAQWICASERQYKIIPVGADWTNREPLLGYVNALDPKHYILPENGALELIIEANNNEDKPYFLILDEMNLSHVERYFADFLSIMESKDTFKLHSSDTPLDGGNGITVAKEYAWPKNLFVVGTVNIDETTYMFSPKVLDRANVIEFRVSETEISKFLTSPKEIDVGLLEKQGATMAEAFVKIAKEKKTNTSESLQKELINFFKELQKVGAEFGYRTAMEIQTLFGQIDVINPDVKSSECFKKYSNEDDYKIDIAIMQKLLPKLHGSRRKLEKVIIAMAKCCTNDNIKTYLETNPEEREVYTEIKYPLSFEKLTRMYDSLIANGFASYAEA